MSFHPPPQAARRPWLAAAVAVVASAALAVLPAAAAAAPGTAFVTDQSNSTLDQFTIGAGGDLAFSGSAAAGSEPWMQAVTPNGKYVYVANFQSGSISQYSIGSAGTLTPLSSAPVSAGNEPYGIAVSPDGRNVYVANDGSGSVGVYDIGSTGLLTLAETVTTDLNRPSGVAVSPDGSSVYIGDQGLIVQFNRASNGTLTPKTPATVPATFSDLGMVVISPDGANVYAASDSSSDVDEYTVGAGGQLTPKAVASVPTGSGSSNYALTISPDGKSVYVPDYANGVVYQFTVGSGGELTDKSPFTAAAGDGSIFLWPTADGTSAYVTNYNAGTISQYNVSSTGELLPKSTPTVTHGGELLSIVIPPDQGPVARFSSHTKGRTAQLNASTSSDSDGTVVRYHWNFGDGHTLTTTKAKVSHTYKKGAKHKVTLTVTDDSGCSTSLVFTGQTAYCNGTAAATTSHTVKVAAARSLRLRVSPNRTKAGQRTCYAFDATSGGHGVRGVSVRLAGRTVHTGTGGTATLCLTLRKGTYTARATKSGYTAAAARIRVSAASPAFTG